MSMGSSPSLAGTSISGGSETGGGDTAGSLAVLGGINGTGTNVQQGSEGLNGSDAEATAEAEEEGGDVGGMSTGGMNSLGAGGGTQAMGGLQTESINDILSSNASAAAEESASAGVPGNSNPFPYQINQGYRPVAMVRPRMAERPNPYAQVPSIYDMYLQAQPRPSRPQRFGSDLFRNGTGIRASFRWICPWGRIM